MKDVLTYFVHQKSSWNDYIKTMGVQDETPIHAQMNSGPMYRGRKKGMEGYLFREQSQLHYSRYPDEHILQNLDRWRFGDTVGDVGLQQFRGAQPFILENEDEYGLKRLTPELYMKLNYKNLEVIGRYLTRTGHYYQSQIMPMGPIAALMLKKAKRNASILGLWPKVGNPYWHRSQSKRPKVYDSEYNPKNNKARNTMEHFTYNWLQTQRVKQHFASVEASRRREKGESQKSSLIESKNDGGYEQPHKRIRRVDLADYDTQEVPYSEKKPWVDGMSLSGYRRNNNLYHRDSARRMGFRNPLGFKRK